MTEFLCLQGHHVNHKRVRRLMRQMGLEAVYPRRKCGLSISNRQHKIYPYLLRGITIARPDQVWSADITYIRMYRGWLYLVAVMDWFSRYVLSWEVSTTLESEFCVTALKRALCRGRPEVFNTDQGSQFTSDNYQQVSATPAGNDFVAISAGYYYSAAVKKDGSIVYWGKNDYGQTVPPATMENMVMPVERTFSWLGNNHRLVVRWDRDITVYNAFFHIACLVTALRRL
ncbi:MAG: DDE-type integrase/transposase/recombinase [Sedimentisphaerales bacterium]|nr:DDE-type integrase/transposase/recombinase [Sedimentisphaerales bacterium]